MKLKGCELPQSEITPQQSGEKETVTSAHLVKTKARLGSHSIVKRDAEVKVSIVSAPVTFLLGFQDEFITSVVEQNCGVIDQ